MSVIINVIGCDLYLRVICHSEERSLSNHAIHIVEPR
jgi:hypothetical protein